MKEAIKDLFTDWPLGTILGILLSGCIIALLFIMSWLVFIACDSWSLPIQTGKGSITGGKFIPAHTTYVPISTGKVTVITPIFHADEWDLFISIKEKQSTASVGQEFYNSCAINDTVGVGYVEGRISGDIYIKSIWK